MTVPYQGIRSEWTGARGLSVLKPLDIPENAAVLKILDEHNREGVRFRSAIPDFRPFRQGVVRMPVYEMMSCLVDGKGRRKIHTFADSNLAAQWNKRPRSAPTPMTGEKYTADDVERYRIRNGLTWHEQNNMKVLELIPLELSRFYLHLGGIGEITNNFEVAGVSGLLESNTIDHAVLGTLVRDDRYYVREMPLHILGREVSCTICLRLKGDKEIEPSQAEAIKSYAELGDNFVPMCEAAIEAHCAALAEAEDEPQEEALSAGANNTRAFCLHFPSSFDEPTWGLACLCDWTDKGLAVKFVGNEIVDVGPEHLLI